MSTTKVDKIPIVNLNNNGEAKKKVERKSKLIFEIDVTNGFMFFFGMFFGIVVLRHHFLQYSVTSLVNFVRGYEYDWEEDCIVKRHPKSGKVESCRPRLDCGFCQAVDQIDIIPSNHMTQDLFMEKYATSGRPLVVTKATDDWLAMEVFDFYFFKDLYLDLNSPVLTNEDPDCQFFSWGENRGEFRDLLEAFDMDDTRIRYENGTKPWYVGWANCDEEAVEILRNCYSEPFFLPPTSRSGGRDWIFIGTPGYGAPFHIDNVKYPSWQAQIQGMKEWSLKPPPECYWSCPGKVDVILNPGDVIVVNTNWWEHSTKVLEEGGLQSVTVTNEYII